MSKGLRIVGQIAGAVATVAMFIPGAQPIAAAAAAVSTLSSVVAGVTQKKPPVRGNTSQVIIGSNLPQPYTMGRTYVGGNLLHDVGYGGADNPYRSMVLEWSCAGPVEAIEAFQSDFTTIAFSGGNAVGYYAGFLYLDTQLGAAPEADALAGPFGAIPRWGASYKLSGHAAGLATLVWDKKGKKFASGVPQLGAILKGVLVYDARQDSLYPGGAGACRVLDEATYVGGAAAQNPGCHGVTYALGRWQNGKKVFGCGFARPGVEATDPSETIAAIDWPAWVEFANVCDANGWTVGGTIYEPGSKWDNLKRICAAGGGEPVWVGARLSVKFNAPKVALDTITAADLAGEPSIQGMKTWRDRKNGLIPKYRSEAHKWEYVQSTLVSVPEYVTQDRGEVKNEERQIDLCQDGDQAAQLIAYELADARELGPIIFPLKPRFIEYRIGEALQVGADLEETGLAGKVLVITGRKVDPATAIVELTMETETNEKHAFALGQVGTAPPTPELVTGEELDDLAGQLLERETALLISTSFVTDAEPADGLLQATDTQIDVEDHTRTYSDKAVAVTGGTLTLEDDGLTAIAAGLLYHIYYDDEARAGGAVALKATRSSQVAVNTPSQPFRHYVGSITTDVLGGTGTSSGGSSPPGWNDDDYHTP